MLTLLAEPPSSTHGMHLPSDVGVLVDDVKAQFAHHGLPLRQVASLAAVSAEVRRFHAEDPAPFCLQLVGHGQPGRLQLSEAWTGEYRSDDDAFALDSNREILDLVTQWRGALSELRLVGCGTGADSSRTSPTDGTILIFTLSHLLRCPVTAAQGTVWPMDFGPDGLYLGPSRTGDPVPPAAPRPSQETIAAHVSSPKLRKISDPKIALPIPTTHAKFEATSLLARAAMHGKRAWRATNSAAAIPLVRTQVQIFLAAYRTPAPYEYPRLSSPEAIFEVLVTLRDYSTVRGRGFLVHDGRCLALDYPSVHPAKALPGERVRSETVYLLADDDEAVGTLLTALAALPKR